MRTFTINEVSRLTGAHINAIKSWRRREFIWDTGGTGWQRFSEDQVVRVGLIMRLLALGMTARRAAYIATRADTHLHFDPYRQGTSQTLLVIASDEVVDQEKDEIGLPRFETVDAGDDPNRPTVPLCEMDEETGKPIGYGWSLGTTDASFVNLTDLKATITKRIEELDQQSGSDD